jgi:two-component system phosphate regulon sensor histidine kinase PhoR
MGYAEIIKNGIAKQGDIPRFASQIHSEASRLLHLIEDIIKLSRLDEKDISREFVPVNLLTLAEIVKSELALKSKEKHVTVEVDGESLSVSGISSTLHEVLFNLCDNAIAYNKPGGSVKITVSRQKGKTVLSVADTGVGIAPEHQERIFERFYRVDKSHSKDTGGTGLGLSIVKHGAKLHGAEVELDSSFGKGTTVKIIFN